VEPASVSPKAVHDDRPRGTGALALVLALISLPAALAVVEAVSYYERYRSNGVMVSSGLEREYLLYVPTSYDRTRPTPLVISLHGAGLWGAAQQEISQWNRVADEHGFIVVYPSGVNRGPRVWEADRGPGLMRDVRFIAELIDMLSAAYNIDSTRVYANGLSNGGGMAFVLSCTLSDRIAAIGVVAPALFLPWSWCTDQQPVSMIAFQGTADRMTPYHGGGPRWLTRRPFPDIPTWVAGWARRNRCVPDPIDSVVVADVTRRAYAHCADDAAVVLYTVQGGGHTWPGGGPAPEWFVGPTSRSIDATSEMWAFFREHRLQE
jgi:polyhydroxybutyrate depolymerase